MLLPRNSLRTFLLRKNIQKERNIRSKGCYIPLTKKRTVLRVAGARLHKNWRLLTFTPCGKKVVSQIEAKLREQHRRIEGLKEEENFNCHKWWGNVRKGVVGSFTFYFFFSVKDFCTISLRKPTKDLYYLSKLSYYLWIRLPTETRQMVPSCRLHKLHPKGIPKAQLFLFPGSGRFLIYEWSGDFLSTVWDKEFLLCSPWNSSRAM